MDFNKTTSDSLTRPKIRIKSIALWNEKLSNFWILRIHENGWALSQELVKLGFARDALVGVAGWSLAKSQLTTALGSREGGGRGEEDYCAPVSSDSVPSHFHHFKDLAEFGRLWSRSSRLLRCTAQVFERGAFKCCQRDWRRSLIPMLMTLQTNS